MQGKLKKQKPMPLWRVPPAAWTAKATKPRSRARRHHRHGCACCATWNAAIRIFASTSNDDLAALCVRSTRARSDRGSCLAVDSHKRRVAALSDNEKTSCSRQACQLLRSSSRTRTRSSSKRACRTGCAGRVSTRCWRQLRVECTQSGSASSGAVCPLTRALPPALTSTPATVCSSVDDGPAASPAGSSQSAPDCLWPTRHKMLPGQKPRSPMPKKCKL